MSWLRARYDIEPCKAYGAIDFGAGGGRDTRLLLNEGWSVAAVDSSVEATRQALGGELESHPDALLVVPTLEEVEGGRGLFNAASVLPFLSPEDLDSTLASAHDKLVPGGILCCNFFGGEHAWANPQRAGVHITTEDEARATLERHGFEVVQLEASIRDQQTSQEGVVRWHDIFVIARKPAAQDQDCCAPGCVLV